MDRKWTTWLTAAAVALLTLAVFAEPALAAPADEAGKNLGDLIRENFTPVVVTIAGVIGIVALVKRDVMLALLLVGLTMIILGFFLDPSPYQKWGDDVLRTVLPGAIGWR